MMKISLYGHGRKCPPSNGPLACLWLKISYVFLLSHISNYLRRVEGMVISFFAWPGKFLMHRFSNPGGESTRSDTKIVVPPQMVHPGVEKNLNFFCFWFFWTCVCSLVVWNTIKRPKMKVFGTVQNVLFAIMDRPYPVLYVAPENHVLLLILTLKKQGKGHAVQPKGRKRKQKVKRTQKCKKKRQRTSTKRKKKVIYIY